ncbi:MAG: hypothetical protein N2114_01250, partial [Candidatus Goldbacteria bacterium]|nr:hypothetical protein [Candidatus Goldiibacteriota bacterium]
GYVMHLYGKSGRRENYSKILDENFKKFLKIYYNFFHMLLVFFLLRLLSITQKRELKKILKKVSRAI